MPLRVQGGFEYGFFCSPYFHPIYALLISLKFEYQYIDISVKGWIFSLMCFFSQKCFNLENIQGVPKKIYIKKKIWNYIPHSGQNIISKFFSNFLQIPQVIIYNYFFCFFHNLNILFRNWRCLTALFSVFSIFWLDHC